VQFMGFKKRQRNGPMRLPAHSRRRAFPHVKRGADSYSTGEMRVTVEYDQSDNSFVLSQQGWRLSLGDW